MPDYHDLLAQALTAPLVVAGDWSESLPKDLRAQVPLQRLRKLINEGDWQEATDAEVTCFLFTASLEAPMQADYAAIYLFLGKQWKPAIGDLAPDNLTPDQERKLREMKHDLRTRQRRAWRAKHRAPRPAARHHAQPRQRVRAGRDHPGRD